MCYALQNKFKHNSAELSAPKSRITIRWRLFTADSDIAGNSAVGISFVREDRHSLAIFDRKDIAHVGPSKSYEF